MENTNSNPCAGIGGSARYPASALRPSFEKIWGLDGLRLLAVTIVLLRHFEISLLVPGGLGVTMFFFISGFLISRLLLAEEQEAGRLDLPSFFIRRFIRLLPPLILMLVVMTPLLLLYLPEKFSWAAAFFNFFYLGNFHGLYVRFTADVTEPSAFGALWSLSVEEHFYLMLPLMLIFVKGIKQRLFGVFVFAALLPLVLRMIVYISLPADQADAFNYSFTFTRIDSMGWGVLLSLALHAGWFRGVDFDRYVIALLAVGIIGTLAAMIHWSEVYTIVWRYTFQTMAIGAGVAATVFATRTAKLRQMLEIRPVAFLGRASYEIYLWHLPVFYLLQAYVDNHVVVVIASLCLTLSISGLAYVATTQLTRNLRRNFGSRG